MAAHTGPTLTGNTLSVTTAAGGVVVAAAATHHRTVIVQNIDSTNPFYVGASSGLTTANGYRIAAGESISLELHPLAVLHAISGGTVEARFIIETGTSSF